MMDLLFRVALILAAPVLLAVAGFFVERRPIESGFAQYCAHGLFYGALVALIASGASVLYAAIGGFIAQRSQNLPTRPTISLQRSQTP